MKAWEGKIGKEMNWMVWSWRRRGEETFRYVEALSGAEFIIVIEAAPHVRLWSHGPWRCWATLTGDHSWWLTVESSEVGWPLVRERFSSKEEASRRADHLEGEIKNSGPNWGMKRPWRRRLVRF